MTITPFALSEVDTAFLVGLGVILALAILLWGVVWWRYLSKEFTEE